MTSEEFDAFFTALTGHAPYRWQRRLFRRWVDGVRYDALDLPTGLGKTSVIAVWLIARLAGAKLPRRLVYVVDRRAVVDQASEVAKDIANRLGPEATGLLAYLRRELGLVDGKSLPVSTLRGQFLDNRLWMDDPSGLAIVVGTVDMIGSRLLFEGYGVSRGMRPAHAGLLGVDTLVLLDEAHLVPPFEAMLRQAGLLMDKGGEARLGEIAPNVARLQKLSLSATGNTQAAESVFGLEHEDWEDAALVARLRAPKRLTLHPRVEAGQLAKALAETALARGQAGRRVIVFCHSRLTAQAVRDALDKSLREAFGRKAALTALLVGERRYRERALLYGNSVSPSPEAAVFRRFSLNRAPDPEGQPAFLIATAAGEVGVDLDADDLVCDLVAWERMVQRFGRVNRRADPGAASIDVIPAEVTDKGADHEINQQLARYARPFESEAWAVEEDGCKDASPAALVALKASELAPILISAQTPPLLRPPLDLPVVEAWSLTSLKEHTGRPKVQPWIRGWTDDKPESRIVWRRRFPLRGASTEITSDLREFFRTASPHLTEALDGPTWRIVEVLRSRASAWIKRGPSAEPEEVEALKDTADDAEAAPAPELEGETEPDHPPVVLLLTSDNEIEDLYTPARLAAADAKTLDRVFAGKTLVVDARLGGLDAHGLLSASEGGRPDTIDMVEPLAWRLPLKETVGRRIRWRVWIAPTEAWKPEKFRWAEKPDQEGTFELWVEVWRGPGGQAGDPAISRVAQGLKEHLTWTGRRAASIADRLEMQDPWRALLIAAAEAHDLGKDRALWQNAMRAKPGEGRPYAKTTGGGNGRALNGYRHEFGSLREVLESPGDFFGPGIADDPDRLDLALHLITAHHGRGRPTIHAYDPGQLPSASAPLARDIALRFARLQRTWGPWGLAWLEALLRAADWAASSQLNDAGGDTSSSAEAPADAEAAHG